MIIWERIIYDYINRGKFKSDTKRHANKNNLNTLFKK